MTEPENAQKAPPNPSNATSLAPGLIPETEAERVAREDKERAEDEEE